MDQAVLSGVVMGSAYVLMSLGFALELEIADIVNAAHGALVVGGMYIVLLLTDRGMPTAVAVLAATVGIAAISYPIYVLLIGPARAQAGHRVQLIYTLLLLSLLAVLYQILFTGDIKASHVTYTSVAILGATTTTAQIACFSVAVVVAVGLFLLSKYTTIGKVAYVAGRYQRGAKTIGIPVSRIYALIFTLAGALAGLAGGMIVTFQPVQPVLGLNYILIVFLIAIVARMHILGCLVLGIVYGVVQAVLGYIAPASVAGALPYIVFLIVLALQQQLPRFTQFAAQRTQTLEERGVDVAPGRPTEGQ